jgi:hypothetical protein
MESIVFFLCKCIAVSHECKSSLLLITLSQTMKYFLASFLLLLYPTPRPGPPLICTDLHCMHWSHACLLLLAALVLMRALMMGRTMEPWRTFIPMLIVLQAYPADRALWWLKATPSISCELFFS